MTEADLERARAGDERAFGVLTEPHRRELRVHCYRMLGSFQDAEDAVQETLVAAWRRLDTFEQRASLRSWLYSIATHRCLNALRNSSRRPRRAGPELPFEPPPPTRMSEVTWLEPYPDRLLDELADQQPSPEARYETREAVGLAFVTALQRLPTRQRSVLVLRDVLGFRAAEVAGMLDLTDATVNSALQRARAALERRVPAGAERAPLPDSPAERQLADAFADAFERGDVNGVVSLLTDDAWVSMPPEPHEYQGHAVIADFLEHTGVRARAHAGRTSRLVPTRANGQPAWANYLATPNAPVLRFSGVLVLTLRGGRIDALTRFGLPELFEPFGLPAQLALIA